MKLFGLIIFLISIIVTTINAQTSGELDSAIHTCAINLLNKTRLNFATEFNTFNENNKTLICSTNAGRAVTCKGKYITELSIQQTSPNNIITGDDFSCFYNLEKLDLTSIKITNDFLTSNNYFKTPISITINSQTGLTQLMPTIASTILELNVPSLSLTGQLTDSYCTVARLNIKNNQISGSIPSCFKCYYKPGSTLVSNFASNQFDAFDFSTYTCNEFIWATLRISNDTGRIYLEGANLGFDASGITSNDSLLVWTIEQGSTRYYSDYANANLSKLVQVNVGITNKVFTLRTIPQPPKIISAEVINNSGVYTIDFVGTDFGYDPTKITITIGGYSCQVVSTTFSNLQCTIVNNDVNNPIVIDQQMLTRFEIASLPVVRFIYSDDGGDDSNPYYNHLIPCPNECNYNGVCVPNYDTLTSFCDCDAGTVGNDCHLPIPCPACKYGSCDNVTGLCICNDSTISGADCSIIACKVADCNNHGTCDSSIGECQCSNDWQGDDCNTPFIQCPYSGRLLCNGLGSCNNQTGICTCNDPDTVTGTDCSIIACKVANCNNHGTCDSSIGKCQCSSDWQGDDCNVPFKECPSIQNNICNAVGSCNNETGICSCPSNWQGDVCGTPFIQCPSLNNKLCNDLGSCNNATGLCTCNDPNTITGADCSIIACKVADCNNHGTCNSSIGECECSNDWQGDDCSVPFKTCPSINLNDCSGFGQCNNQTGICTCIQGKIYEDCSETGIECSTSCLNGGSCDISIGKCKCPSNYRGEECKTPVHYVSSVDPCNSSGGQVIIYGWFSNTNNQLSVTIGGLNCEVDLSLITEDSITCQLGAGIGTKDVDVTQNGSSFIGKNKFQYINTNNKCPKDCSGKGECQALYGTCSCNEGWTGFDCGSPKPNGDNKDIPISITKVNIETGNTAISNQDTNYDISIISLVEMDFNNNIVVEHDLKNDIKWDSIVDSDKGTYKFSHTLKNSTCIVSYTIQEIKQDTQYEFAGMKLSLDKGSVKVTVSITDYQYVSSLNTLQLRFISLSSEIPTTEPINNKCNEKESIQDTSNVDPNQSLNYISISKNSKILAGRFINKVVSDSRPTFLSSEVVDSNSTTIIVGLNLPRCSKECLIDPDFSVLVSTDFNPNCNGKENSRKWVIPVAVVVPVVCICAITLVCVALYKKHRYSIRLFTMKKSFSVRQKLKLRSFK